MRLLIAIIIFSCKIHLLIAQNVGRSQGSRKDILLLPRIGLALSTSTASINPPADVGFHPGLSAALGLEFGLIKRLNLITELGYADKGFHAKGDNDNGSADAKSDITHNYHYLELPVMLRKRFGGDKLGYYFNVGGFLDYGLGGSVHIIESTYTSGTTFSIGHSDRIYAVKYGSDYNSSNANDFYLQNRVDYGVAAGGGLIILNKVLVDIRYLSGSKNIQWDSNSKNRSWSISAIYQLPIRHKANPNPQQ
jgi:Outer membrane protein beta-barrel domain